MTDREAGLSDGSAYDLLVVKALNNVSSVIFVGTSRSAECHGQVTRRRIIQGSSHISS